MILLGDLFKFYVCVYVRAYVYVRMRVSNYKFSDNWWFYDITSRTQSSSVDEFSVSTCPNQLEMRQDVYLLNNFN